MTLSITHTFQSAKADGVDLTLVQPSNWNDEHTITMATGKFLGRATAGAGAVEELTLTDYSVQPGMMMVWPKAGDVPPTGWVFCDGHTENRTTQAALFAAIGTTYGVGNGSTTFNVPDMRGRLAIGRDNMGGSIAGVLTVVGANATGTKFGNNTHTHSGTGLTGTGVTVASNTDFNDGVIVFASGGGGQASQNSHTHAIPALTVNVSSITGNTSASNHYMPAMVLNWIIKL